MSVLTRRLLLAEEQLFETQRQVRVMLQYRDGGGAVLILAILGAFVVWPLVSVGLCAGILYFACEARYGELHREQMRLLVEVAGLRVELRAARQALEAAEGAPALPAGGAVAAGAAVR